jgi:hypothetical protein
VKASLRPHYFEALEREFVSHDDLRATIYKTDTGVDVVRLSSSDISLEILPFQGQQIWSAHINGRNITMGSEVDEPVVTTDYLRNYGAFLVHCGATAMGGPSPDDTHPLHGELPNAPYNAAWVEAGTDEQGRAFIEVHGHYKHQVAMTGNYLAHPVVRITEGEPLVHVSMTVENRSKASMDFMYLAHLNFAPVLGSTIVGTHGWDANSIQVRSSFPSHVNVPEETRALLLNLAEHPERTAQVQNDPAYDPEAVMTVKYISDDEGFAHTLQLHPNGTSDYVRHEPSSAPNAIRCVQLTDHHQCVGIVLPSTAGVEGYITEKANGKVISIPGGGRYDIAFDFASLDVTSTRGIQAHIADVIGATR